MSLTGALPPSCCPSSAGCTPIRSKGRAGRSNASHRRARSLLASPISGPRPSRLSIATSTTPTALWPRAGLWPVRNLAAGRMTRAFSWLRHAAGTAAAALSGPVLVVAVFLAFQGLIPASVAPRLASLTVLLAGTLGLAVVVFRSRPAGLAAAPRWLRGGAAGGLPAGRPPPG